MVRLNEHNEFGLSLHGPAASTSQVQELLYRLSVEFSLDKRIPCCAQGAKLPQLPADLTPYVWEIGEAGSRETQKGLR